MSFFGSNAPAEAQIKTCSKASIPGNLVTASGNDGNIQQNTVDNSLVTRWSNLGFPSWIQYDLGAPRIVCYVDIAWYRGDVRVNTFMISVSEDNVNFQTILKLRKSSGLTSGFERYEVPDTNARYLRITVTGTTEGSWASISEVAIHADKAASPCTSHQVFRVAGNWYDGYVLKNTLDNNLNTRWTNFGLPSSISYDYGTAKTVCDLDIAWYRGDRRVNTFTVSVSNDNVNYYTIGSAKSSGLTSGFERYNVPDTNARYVKITITGNTEGDHVSISEMDVNAATTAYDNFEGSTYSLTDGQVSPNQKWKCRFTGFGTVKVVEGATGNNYMYLAPKASTSPGETHAAAVDTTTKYKDFDLTLDVHTIDQLRQNSPPNNWETAWVNWNSIDQFHYYGFTLKISGNQLEKKDNDIQDDTAEIFLVTQSSPSVKLDTWQKWRIKVTGTESGTPHIEIWIDGAKIVDYIDNKSWIPRNSEKMKQGGTITLYTEDAAVAFDNVNITPL